MSVEATIKDNENRWAAAGMKHDVATVETMVADDFVGVSSKGKFKPSRAVERNERRQRQLYIRQERETRRAQVRQ